jgi:peptidoglycan/LPS O-acetylase OafA/YrhL
MEMRIPAASSAHACHPAGGFQPEIQGMRALSVLAVVLAHAAIPGFGGGFIGVDVFFVISGFLITRLLLAEIERTGRIDLPGFWARRARRLLPNAFAALLGTLVLALAFFPVPNPATLIREISLAALEVVNFHFARKAADYFQADGPVSPVVHFWSLAIEEQFYLVWPVLLGGTVLAFKRSVRRAALILLAVMWCASFAACVMQGNAEQAGGYFRTETRIWQLATGALLAAGWPAVERLAPHWRAAMAWLGAGAILAGIAVIPGGRGYPGLWALMPTLGAAGLIAGFGGAAPQSVLRRSLNLPVMQWIGARSYSWYLWHWPLLALPRIAYPDNVYFELIAVPASLAIACAAYAWIETPFREGGILRARPAATLAGAAAALLLTLGATQLSWSAFSVLRPDLAARITEVETASKARNKVYLDGCHLDENDRVQGECRYGDAAAPRRVVLFGDSHAAQWFEPLRLAAGQTGWQLQAWTKSACPSADAHFRLDSQRYAMCRTWYEERMAQLTGPGRPDLVILSNSVYHLDDIWDVAAGGVLAGSAAEQALRDGFRGTVQRLAAAGVEVVVIRDIPKAARNYRNCYIAGRRCSTPQHKALSVPDLAVEAARGFDAGVRIVDLTDEFCRNGECAITRDGMLMYRDGTHLAANASVVFAPVLAGHLKMLAAALPAAKPSLAAEARLP